MSGTPDGWKHIHRRGIYRICVCRWKNVGGACQGAVPVMAERAGMPLFEWSSGSVFDLRAQARTGPGGTRNQRNNSCPRGRARGCAISSIQYIGVLETGTTTTDGLVSNKPQ
jgi:hypothetical protein